MHGWKQRYSPTYRLGFVCVNPKTLTAEQSAIIIAKCKAAVRDFFDEGQPFIKSLDMTPYNITSTEFPGEYVLTLDFNTHFTPITLVRAKPRLTQTADRLQHEINAYLGHDSACLSLKVGPFESSRGPDEGRAA